MKFQNRSRRRFRSLAVAGFLSLIAASASWAESTYLRIYRDESKIIRVDALKRVSVTNPGIAQPVIISPSEIMLHGVEVGRTSLYIWDTNGRTEIQVVVRPFTDELQRRLEEDIDDPNVEIQIIAQGNSEKVFLRGILESEASRVNALAVAEAYVTRANVVDLLEVRGSAQDPHAELTRLIGNPNIKIEVILREETDANGNTSTGVANIVLEGSVDDQMDYDRVAAIAAAYSGGANQVTNLIEIANPLQVQIEAHLVEKTRTENEGIGVNWGTFQQPNIAAGATSFTINRTFVPNSMTFLENFLFGVSRGDLGGLVAPNPEGIEDLKRLDPVAANLSWQLSSGIAKVIHNPKVVTRSGEAAEIFVGGQVGTLVQANGLGGQNVQLLPFGLTMNVTPTIDRQGNINASVQIEFSNPDQALGAGGAPGFRNRRTNNTVSVRDGEHIVISGLINKDDQETISKVPGLWKLPVLGRLFQSKTFQSSETELVVIITPHLMASKQMRRRFFPDPIAGVLDRDPDANATPALAGVGDSAPKPLAFQDNASMVSHTFASLQEERQEAKENSILADSSPAPQGQGTVVAQAPEVSVHTEEVKQAMERMREKVYQRLPSQRKSVELAQAPPPAPVPRSAPLPSQAMAPVPVPLGLRNEAPSEAPLVPVGGSITSRIHGIFEEMEQDPGPELSLGPSSGFAEAEVPSEIDQKVDELFLQIRSKLGSN